jgi:hypothetical protein
VGAYEALPAAGQAKFERVNQQSPGEAFLLENAKETVRWSETAMQALRRQFKKSFGWQSHQTSKHRTGFTE